MVAAASARLARFKQVTVLEANCEYLPFEDASFDRYISNLCLHLTSNPAAMIKEASRGNEQQSLTDRVSA